MFQLLTTQSKKKKSTNILQPYVNPSFHTNMLMWKYKCLVVIYWLWDVLRYILYRYDFVGCVYVTPIKKTETHIGET